MVGQHPGHITTQGMILAEHFKKAGYPVMTTSSILNPYARLGDMVWTLIRARHEFDIVILDIYARRSLVAEEIISLLVKWLGKPMIMVLRGGTIPHFFDHHCRWISRVLRRARILVAPSPFMSRIVTTHGLTSRIIPNMVNLVFYPFRSRSSPRPRLLWMRSFKDIWNPLMAVRVLALLREHYPDAVLTMAGKDKGLEGEAKDLARRLGIQEAVRFVGFLDRPGKAREFQKADIFINTNTIDNMPVAVLEAAAAGLPIVATKVGGIPDLLTHEENALLVPSQDDRAMTSAITRLIEEPGLAQRLSENGRRLALRSSWESVLPMWNEVFKDAVGT